MDIWNYVRLPDQLFPGVTYTYNTNYMKKLQIYIASDDSHVLKAAQAE
jgi:hypothetical protein